MVIRHLPAQELGRAEAFIRRQDRWFTPRIVDQTPYDRYVAKLSMHGHLLVAEHNAQGPLLGLVGYYCNDQATRVAYISYLAVDDGQRGTGLAAALMQAALDHMRASGMEQAQVKCSAHLAGLIGFYQKLGFAVIRDEALPSGVVKCTLARAL